VQCALPVLEKHDIVLVAHSCGSNLEPVHGLVFLFKHESARERERPGLAFSSDPSVFFANQVHVTPSPLAFTIEAMQCRGFFLNHR
jgi:hypothetical protein